jgi:hypothetical protein
LMARIGGRFARVESRRRAYEVLVGLLSELPVKNCWTISEYVGDSSPDGLQNLLAKAVWDTDGVVMTCVPTSWSISAARTRCW